MKWILLAIMVVLTFSWSLHKLENTNVTNAVCNDGSPGAYYFRKGNSKKWVIHLQGGWWCWDEKTCKSRWETLRPIMTSNLLSPNISQSNGIFHLDSSKNPSFYDANFVWVHYCSSDSFSGDRIASPETFGFHFRGKNIITSVIQDLIEKRGMNDASEILFTGCSAGGMGVLVNIDHVGSIVTRQIPNVKYQAYVDAGHFIDYNPLVSVDGHLTQVKKGRDLWNGIPNQVCTREIEPHRCFLGQYGIKYVISPTLVFNSLIDSFQVGYGLGNWSIDLGNPIHRKYTDYVASKARYSFQDHGKLSIFAPNCLVHCVSFDDAYSRVTVKGTSQKDFVERWWRSNGSQQILIEDCQGLQCSQKC